MKKRAFFVFSMATIGCLSFPLSGAIRYPQPRSTTSIPQPVVTPAPQPPGQTTPASQNDNAINENGIQYPDEIEREMVEARKAAQAWLKLVDEGKYEESWEQGSVSFKNVMPKKTWVQALGVARRPLGPVQGRSVRNQAPAMNPNRMPPGIYMVINFDTSFSQASKSGEFMTMRKDPDGQWRILDYRVN